MKRFVYRCAFATLLALCAPAALGQGAEGGTEVVLVGTVHSPTARFTEETLVSILKRVGPDLVLLELDPSFFDASGALPEKYRGISMENKAVFAYGKGVRLRPFDVEGRNRFYQEQDYFGRELRLNQELGRLYGAGRLAPEARLLFEGLRALAAVRDACGAERPEVVNSSACDAAVERKQDYAFKGIGKIVGLTPALKEFAAFWALADDFWARRNDAMVANVVRHAKGVRGGRVVVLCGFEHRYYLRARLAERARQEGFVLKEYWEY